MKEYQGMLRGDGRRFGIVVARFNEVVTGRLLASARDCLLRHGVEESDIQVAWVPGAWEIPGALRRLGRHGSFDALLALGAVVRGGTPHFEYVSGGVASGVAAAGAELDLPVAFGVLTADTMEQAMDRAGGKAGNKGWEAALAALEVADLYARMNADSQGA